MRDHFDWTTIEDDIVIPEQAQIAVYNNPNGGVVCRQAGQYGPDEDSWIFFHPSHALALVKAILSKAGLDDLAIVHVSQLRVQNGGGELLQPFPDQATVDAVDRAGDAADLDDDQGEDRGGRKRKAAAERQRRRREKQRQRDSHGSERDIGAAERDVTPIVPELDFQNGGPLKALTN
jgi:hypothetical protein